MIRKLGLRNHYIKVKRKEGELSFGGDQNLFGFEGATKADEQKKRCGCGIVAFSDLILYLASNDVRYCTKENYSYVNRELSEETYKEYFNRIYDFIGGITHKMGISGFTLWFRFNRMARQNRWPLRAKWGFSGKKIFSRTQEMLQKDIPVILCIPAMLLKKDKDDKLSLYKRKQREDGSGYYYQKAQETNAHYVMVTEILWEQEEVYFKISSWGKEYYINLKEYDTYINHHFLGKILGNILYIR